MFDSETAAPPPTPATPSKPRVNVNGLYDLGNGYFFNPASGLTLNSRGESIGSLGLSPLGNGLYVNPQGQTWDINNPTAIIVGMPPNDPNVGSYGR